MGVLAYLAGYLVTFAFVLVESDRSSVDTNEYVFEVVGWLFYNAQFVATETSASGAGMSTTQTENTLAQAMNLTIPRPLWTLAVVVVLVGAGYVAAGRTSGPSVAAGAAVVAGYLPLAVAGTFVFTVDETAFGANVSVAPETIPAILLAGVVFPVVCGAIGGVLNSSGDL